MKSSKAAAIQACTASALALILAGRLLPKALSRDVQRLIEEVFREQFEWSK